MDELFRNVLNASVQGSIVIAAVLLLRLMLKKAPKKYICLLWILAGIRLLMPFSIESKLSLQPPMAQIELDQVVSVPVPELMQPVFLQPELEQPEALAEEPDAGKPNEEVPNSDAALPLPENTEQTGFLYKEEGGRIEALTFGDLAAVLWACGVCGMLLYSAISYLLLKNRIREAIRTEAGIWETDRIGTAFILGYFNPQIYLPMGLTEQQRQMILQHEKCHLRRFDHWTKLIGFITLAIHWFNPLVWLAYGMLCQEIEMACDELVVEKMDLSQRKCYSQALLAFSARGHLACPVAFGEKPVKRRIRAVLNYRKPAFWLTLCALVAIVFVAVSLLTSPKAEQEEVILRAGYAGPYEPYETYHTTEREQKWEEDILYLAEMMLTKHPRLYDGDTFILYGFDDRKTELSNAMFDAQVRERFVAGIDTLIPQLADLSDEQIPFELNKLMAMVGDEGSCMYISTGKSLRMNVEPIWNGDQVSLHAVVLPKEYENLMFGELTAINGVATEEIIEQLLPYVAYRNEQWAIRWLTGVDYYENNLLHRGALSSVGVVEADAESAEITIRTDAGEQTITLPFLTFEEQKEVEYVFKHLYATDIPPHRYLDQKNIWCEVMDDAVYLQIVYIPYETNELDQALIQATTALRDAPSPKKLIIDLRIGAYGDDAVNRLKSFASQVNTFETAGTYILIDSLTHYHGPDTAYRLKHWIDGAVLVGNPTGISLNMFGYSGEYKLTYSENFFGVMEKYFCADADLGNSVLQPDVLVQQTLEDYKNGIDTVFQYALDAENEPVKLSRQQKEEITNNFFDELRRIQNAEEIAFDVSTTLESDYEFFRGHEQTWWISGDDWYRVFHYTTNMGEYSEEYLQTDGKQYARREAAHILKLGDLEWTQLPDEQVTLPPLLTQDWTNWHILDIREEPSSDGGVIKVLVQGDMESTPEKTYYEHTHEFHLDQNGRLVGLVEYSFTDQYINQLGTEGRFYMKGWSHVTFKSTKAGVVKDTIQTAAEEALAAVGA